jgi:hypothetical protein
MRIHAFLFNVGMLASVVTAQSHLRIKNGKDVPDNERRRLAPSDKVEICHIPPDDPESFKTISVSGNAVAAHLEHGDIEGACNDLCDVLCDDGNPCTEAVSVDCKDSGCPEQTPSCGRHFL